MSCDWMRDPRQHLEGGPQIVGVDRGDGGAQLVQHQLHPQLGGLVDDDEQPLVVLVGKRLLAAQEGVELQIVAVGQRSGKSVLAPGSRAGLGASGALMSLRLAA